MSFIPPFSSGLKAIPVGHASFFHRHNLELKSNVTCPSKNVPSHQYIPIFSMQNNDATSFDDTSNPLNAQDQLHPDDIQSQLSLSLDRLASNIGSLPQPNSGLRSRASPPFEEDDEKDKEAPHFSREQLKQFNIEQNSSESWTFEQRALYSLFDDEAKQWEEPKHIPKSLLSEEQSDMSQYAELRKSQNNPRKINANEVKTTLGSIKRRRQKLATQRGEDAVKAVYSMPQDLNDNSSPIMAILSEIDRERIKNIISDSLAESRIIDFATERKSPRRCEITTAAEYHLNSMWGSPHVVRPNIAVLEAFKRVDNPPCPRCRTPTPFQELQNEKKICDNCYSFIYLQSPPGSIPGDPGNGQQFWSREEVEREEERTVSEATQVLLKMNANNMRTTSRNSATTESSNLSSSTLTGSKDHNSRIISGSREGKSGMNGQDGNSGGNKPRSSDGWNVAASDRSLRTVNPIRNLVQNIDVTPNPDKELIKLSVGDPTIYGNLKVSPHATNRFCEVIKSGLANGYSMSMGSEEARQAVANRYSSAHAPLSKEDVILASGTSGALEIAIGTIANEGDNVLLPQPGFPLFRTIAEGYGIECRYYRVNAEKNWEIELADLARLADDRTRAIVTNNPSNPCGSVYSLSHIEDVVMAASALRLPIIADEVYADMVFSDHIFTAMASVKSDVPILSVGGISKQFVVPGWRLGWVLMHDRGNVLKNGKMYKGMQQLTTRMLVPNTPAQAVLPTLLSSSNDAFRELMAELEGNAQFTMASLAECKGLQCVAAQGAMYTMAKVDVKALGLKDDMEFTKELLREEAVFVLPGQCFQAENFVRIVFAAPRAVLSEAYHRIRAFCARRTGGM